ncbi:MAG: universal stress protein [Candidatus Obscuribacterales bacterium]
MKVLIAVDSCSSSDSVLSQIASRRWSPSTEFELLMVVEHCHVDEMLRQLLHQSQIILSERADLLKLKLQAKSVKTTLLEGKAAESIVNYAREIHADLIIIGSHGDAGRRMAKVGSVAAAVVDHAPCSVEVVKIQTSERQAHPTGV